MGTTSNNSSALDGIKDQLSKGMIIQSYSNSVLQQAYVDFSAEDSLLELQTETNNGLRTAKTHATKYLSTISPNIINSISALNNYCTLYRTLPATLPVGSTVDQWIQGLQAVKSISEINLRDAKVLVIDLTQFSQDLSTDSLLFDQMVHNINQKIGGDAGALASLSSQLSSIDTQIGGDITATVFGGLAIVGGVFMIIVGSVAGFVTEGTSAELVIGGVAMVVAGVGTEIGTIIALKSLYDQKGDLLKEQAQLKAEVILVKGISSAYTTLAQQVSDAADASKYMTSAWQLLSADLESMINDLQNGILSADAMRTMFITETNTDIDRMVADITTIKSQMAGVMPTAVPPGSTMSAVLENYITTHQN